MVKENLDVLHLGLCSKGNGNGDLIQVVHLESKKAFVEENTNFLFDWRNFFYNLGKKTAGFYYFRNEDLNLVCLHPLKREDAESVCDLSDLQCFAKGITDIHPYRLGIIVGEERVL